MREIKFRGKRLTDGKWLYGYLLTIKRNYGIDYRINGTNENCRVIPETVGQFTGLKDKNGKDIYEGDILKMDVGNEIFALSQYSITCKVVYGYMGFGAEIGFTGAYNSGIHITLQGQGSIEVIGNIHNNPELLEN